MGLKWGYMAKVFGRYQFYLSPFEQKPMKGFISGAVVQTTRRWVGDYVLLVSVYTLAGYSLIKWCYAENERISRKNPKDFENDV